MKPVVIQQVAALSDNTYQQNVSFALFLAPKKIISSLSGGITASWQ
ncbi:hypothetical protein V1951_11510 [Yersinia sp. 2544 StPb PI]